MRDHAPYQQAAVVCRPESVHPCWWCCAPDQVRKFRPKVVAIRDASKVAELREAIKGVDPQPEILTGDQGAIDVAAHPDVDAVVTGIVGAWRRKQTPQALNPEGDWQRPGVIRRPSCSMCPCRHAPPNVPVAKCGLS